MQLEHRVSLEPLLERRGLLSSSSKLDEPGHGHRYGFNIVRRRSHSWTKMMLYSAGIFISYGIFGVVQEGILKERYGPGDEQFDYFYSLLFVQCLVNAFVAKALIWIFRLGTDHTARFYYVSGSSLYLGGMVASFAALKYIDYPTQVVAKSAKPLPVMCLGVLFTRKRYSILKWFCVVLIVLGVALFILEDGHKHTGQTSWFGNVLLAMSLAADGFLSTLQDHMKQEASGGNLNALHMMYANNAVAVAYMIIVLFVMGSNEFPRFLTFVHQFPRLYGEVALFTVSSALGQIFICSTIVDFGPLVCSIITTVRKFFTILGSVLFFGSQLNDRQWFASGLVFGGLVFDASSS